MRRSLKLYGLFLIQHMKILIEYRVDFIIGILSFLFTQLAGIIFIWAIFLNVNELAGWTRDEILLIYAMFQLPRGLDHLFTDNIWLIPQYVRMGQMDKYLTKPINVLFHIIIERFQFEALGELIVGISLFFYVTPVLTLHWTMINIIYLIILLIIGTVIYTSIKLMTASLSFWIRDSQVLMVTVYDIASLTKNPLAIYPSWIRFVLVYIIPFAFTSYFPSAFLLAKEEPSYLVLQGVITSVVLFSISYFMWNRGLSRYEASGT